MRTTKQVKRSEVFSASGPLAQVADQAAAAGFRYFQLEGTLFELDDGRVPGSTLGMHSLRGARLID